MPHDKMIYISKAQHMHASHHNLSQMLNRTPHLCFLHPQKNLPPCIYRLWGDPQAGKIRLLCGAQCMSQVSSFPPVQAWRSSASSLPCSPPKSTRSQLYALFKVLIFILTTLNSFSSELTFKFFPYVIKPRGNKEKIGEWRKTMMESVRGKGEVGETEQMAAICWWIKKKPSLY